MVKKALIVDDTKNIRTLLTTCLELNGYDVISASDGQQALELFRKEKIDIAFLDIKMPEVSGTEVLRSIRDMGIDTPVIIMTAFGTVKNAVECTKLGAIAYLQKPFTADKIKNVLQEFENQKKDDEIIEDHLKLGKQLMAMGKNEDALRHFKKALAVNPSLGEVYYLVATIYNEQGQVKDAEKFFEAAKLFNYEIKQ